mgnify:CR=1 FL=1
MSLAIQRADRSYRNVTMEFADQQHYDNYCKVVRINGGKIIHEQIADIFRLNSVGCYVNPATLQTSADIKFTSSECIHIDDRTDEWFSRLDDEDFGTIKNLIATRDTYV